MHFDVRCKQSPTIRKTCSNPQLAGYSVASAHRHIDLSLLIESCRCARDGSELSDYTLTFIATIVAACSSGLC